MTLVGITGGIGSGKSTVAELLKGRGWTVFSSDQTAKQIMATDPDVRSELAAAFGEQILTPSGVNAPLLATLVFGADPESGKRLARLNGIVHPRVLDVHMHAIQEEEKRGTRFVAIESALIYEVDLEDGFDYVVVVDAPHEACLERVMQRSKLTRQDVERRMAEQMSPEEKRGLADFVIDNAGTLDDLKGATQTVAMVIEAMAG
ncbi:MAG: dephospho-CoA kinase [Candidatus Kapabacteria bacterium]|nr:dephospho-CoA kinase [Candidatus Kapabacteria bacterium]